MTFQEYDLLKKRNFLPLFITQFCGAFNDNAFKLAMLTLISYYLASAQHVSEFYQVSASALFIFPFLIFSAIAGQLADKYDKSRLTNIIKFFEVLLMLAGSLAIFYGNICIMMLVLAGMGLHSTFFGPIKYAILPDHLEKEQLLPATALVEGSTFIAILLGTTLGALSVLGKGPILPVIMLNFFALTGFVSSFFIPRAPSKSPDLQVDWQIWRSTKTLLYSTLGNPQLAPVIVTIAWFWLIGAVLLIKLPDYVHYVLHAGTTVFALFLALFSLGIAFGSVAISRALSGEITLRFVPLAMLCLSWFALDIYWATPKVVTSQDLFTFGSFLLKLFHWRLIFDFFFFSFCGGLFIVPLYTYLQINSSSAVRARVIAANNIMCSTAMVIGCIFVMIMLKLHLTIALVFLILAICNTIAALIFWIRVCIQVGKCST